jgi:hypothetical protein
MKKLDKRICNNCGLPRELCICVIIKYNPLTKQIEIGEELLKKHKDNMKIKKKNDKEELERIKNLQEELKKVKISPEVIQIGHEITREVSKISVERLFKEFTI